MTKATGTTEFIQLEELLNNEEFGEQLLKMAIGSNNLADISPWRLGDIRQSVLPLDEFQARAGDNWVTMTGQDITGSDLATNYSITSLPDLVTDGRFLAQVASGESIFDLQASQLGDHEHNILSNAANTGNTEDGQLYLSRYGRSGTTGYEHAAATGQYNIWTYRTSYDGDAAKTEGYSTNMRVNFFIKINNTPTNL